MEEMFHGSCCQSLAAPSQASDAYLTSYSSESNLSAAGITRKPEKPEEHPTATTLNIFEVSFLSYILHTGVETDRC